MDRIQHIGTLVKMNLYFVFYAIFPPHIFPAEGGADMRKLLLTGCGLVLALYLLLFVAFGLQVWRYARLHRQ